MVLLILWLLCGVICAAIAASKHRSIVGWFFLGCLLGVIGLIIILVIGDAEARHQTIIIQQSVGGAPAVNLTAAVQAPVDTSRWPKRDRDLYTESHPRQIEITRSVAHELPPVASPSIDPTAFAPVVTALKVLAQAGRGGMDEAATEAIMTYLESECGNRDFSRREAAQLTDWIRKLPSDEPAIRLAVRALVSTIHSRSAFYEAMRQIAGDERQTELQGRWVATLERIVA